MADSNEAGRKLRAKERKTYTDEDLDDDDIEGKRAFNLEDKLQSKKYNKNFVKVMKGHELNMGYLQANGLETPIVMYDKTGLGMRVPSQNFRVNDVKQCVGSRRVLDVMDVTTQKGKEMTMREWVQYFENPERERLLNVISLEFSHTKLENYVESPTLVRQVDWVDTVWPQYLKECQTESTNIIDKMKYPKVQKYCLMSVKGCFTDFHIDFGGTSVWYHILHGQKVFWLIPPTEKNIDSYITWTLSGKQGDFFLADHVEGCERIELNEGYTFIIPSGWIHAVYTPKDSLVFGGNFLHSYNIVNQLRVSEVEDKTHVRQKFRYPFYAEIAWYVLAQYIKCVSGKEFLNLRKLPEEKEADDITMETFSNDDDSRPPSRCSQENGGIDIKPVDLKDVIAPGTPKMAKSVTIELTRIDQSPIKRSPSDDECSTPGRRRSPRKSSSDSCSSADTEIYERPDEMVVDNVNDVEAEKDKKVDKPVFSGVSKMEVASADVSEVTSTSGSKSQKWIHLTKWELQGLRTLVEWLEGLAPTKKGVPKELLEPESLLEEAKQLLMDHAGDNPALAVTGDPVLFWPPSKKKMKPKMKLSGPKKSAGKGSPSSGVRRRRTRCKKCEPCTRNDCGECNFCKDMKKYGGPGRMKQSCISRQCLAPVIPHAAVCMICGKDDRIKESEGSDETTTTLMECGICWEIVHPPCIRQKYENLDNNGKVNEDLPNSWECPKCCHDGKQGQLKPRIFKGVGKTGKGGEASLSCDSPGMDINHMIKTEDEDSSEGKRVTSRQTLSPLADYIDHKHEDMQMTKDTMETEEEEVTPEGDHFEDVKRKKTMKNSVSQGNLKKGRGPLKKVKLRRLSGQQISQRRPLHSIMTKRKSPVQLKPTGKLKSPGQLKLKKSPIKRKRDQLIDSLSPREQLVGNPVITRSGRTVKKSPQLTDENMSSDMPRKRARREGLSTPTGSPKHAPKTRHSSQSPGGSGGKLRQRPHNSSPGGTGVQDTPEGVGRPKKSPRKLLMAAGGNAPSQKETVSSTRQNIGVGPTVKRKKLSVKAAAGVSGSGSLGQHSKNVTVGQTGRSSAQPGKGGAALLPGKSGAAFDPTQFNLKEPKLVLERYVVRPAPPSPPPDHLELNTGRKHVLKRMMWLKIFSYLSGPDLVRCMAVNKMWYRWCLHHTLWKYIDISNTRILQTHLIGIVKRQPYSLQLNSVTMTQMQLSWLLARIPQLKDVSLASCSWTTVSALCLTCPLLSSLNLNWVAGLTEDGFQDIITPPTERIPGMHDVSRLHCLKVLSLAGTGITDSSLALMAEHLTRMENLDLSYCTKLSNAGMEVLLSPHWSIHKTIRKIDISGCRRITESVLDLLTACNKLRLVVARNCTGISKHHFVKASSSSNITYIT
ncbi:lysine-specific demethylase 2A-like [Mizuhopecten yessoensis]|uniref:[histone H3]-dimethyl-L-lysine(36) demethylase n=1 Tax=Mizuhopecten yessoensis TaxID=6573 RepID=A0A210PX00_MIZYE|nr:lysine-specific demethylase 2A-like [Mizuhopecten yessoensis]OWF40995.1 Lysine-specific demethylase 2B [Mizuhopecten yessoensis]